MTFTYFPNVPNAPDDPADDQPQMQVNTASISDLISVDHVGFNTTNGGYHKVIHQITQGSDPAAILGFNQVYSKSYTPDTTGGTADTQLFNRTSVGSISQLTGRLAGASNGTDGWVWAGGILLQWGTVSQAFSSGSTTGTVTFKDRVAGAIPFPNFCFNVQTTPLVSFASLPSSQASINIRQSTLSNTSFQWQFFTNSNQYIGFFWWAVGI